MGKQQKRHGAGALALMQEKGNGAESGPSTPREVPAPATNAARLRRDVATGAVVIDVTAFEVMHEPGRVVAKFAAVHDNGEPITIGLAMSSGIAWKLSQQVGVAGAQSSRDVQVASYADDVPRVVVATDTKTKAIPLPSMGRAPRKGK